MSIFVSYSHQDFEYVELIQKKISNRNLINLWVDREQIKPGDEWRKKLVDELQKSSAALILAGDNYFASKFIQEVEYPYLIEQAKKNKIKLFWIPLTRYDYEEHELSKFQSLLNPETPLYSFKSPPERLDDQLYLITQELKGRVAAISKPKPSTPPPEIPEGYTKVVGLSAGLKLLMETINQVESQEEVIFLRLIPSEITTTMISVAKRDEDTLKIVKDYLAFVEKVVQGGNIGVEFWDKSIYGRLDVIGESRTTEFNKASFDFINSVFFTDPPPDTTVVGISEEVRDEWVFIVCSSDDQSAEPKKFLCTLRLRSYSDPLKRPIRGEFTTNLEKVRESYQSFIEFVGKLEYQNRIWMVAELLSEKQNVVRAQIEDFILNGKIIPIDK